MEELQKEAEKLVEELEEYRDKYRRALAETENVRRQSGKRVEDSKQFAIQGFCKDLLEVCPYPSISSM